MRSPSRSSCVLAASAALVLSGWVAPADGALTSMNLLGYWDFNDASNPGVAANVSGVSPNATVNGAAVYSADQGGFSGQAGDRSMDFGANGNDAFVMVPSGTHLDSAFTADSMAVSFWQYSVGQPTSDSTFWITSPTAVNNQRGFQAHVPWSNSIIYFDHSGCCNAPQRTTVGDSINAGFVVNDTWKHYVFQKDAAGNREIWVDGVKAGEQAGGDSLLAFDGRIYIGGQPNATDPNAITSAFGGRVDDFAVWNTTLSESEIGFLAGGGSPLALIPEPSGALFLGLGGLMFLVRRRRC